jgi:hypothetical protein
MYLYFLERIGVLSKFKIDFALLFTKRIIYNSLAFLTGPITFSLFCVYQYSMTGYFLRLVLLKKDGIKSSCFRSYPFLETQVLTISFILFIQ